MDGDAEHAVRLDANFDETWGDKLELDTILEHGENKVHESGGASDRDTRELMLVTILSGVCHWFL